MSATTVEKSAYVIEQSDLDRLFSALRNRGYQIVGPAIRDGAIIYEELGSTADLAVGWSDDQGPGAYRLKARKDKAIFAHNAGANSLKNWLRPPQEKLWQATLKNKLVTIEKSDAEPVRRAFIGVRSCDLHAMAIQDRVLMAGPYADTRYAARRKNVLIIAVNCTRAGATCFCASMDTGPRAGSGFDLALTELLQHDRHFFTVESGSEAGREIVAELALRPAAEAESAAAGQAIARAAAHMGRKLDTGGLKELLYANYENARWENVAGRCLNCGNCTMVCPTCFCTTAEDVTELIGKHTTRFQTWDSCFTMQFSYIHGGNIRATAKARYRQWMMHKLATWFDQFGTSGCVGCGRCITWCPVGIDITEEARAIRETDRRNRKAIHGNSGTLPASASVLP